MNEQDQHEILVTTISMFCDDLTNDNLVSLFLALELNQDISDKPYFDKIKSLFTETNEGFVMHEENRKALSVVINHRISGV